MVAAVREAVGDEVDLMIEVHGRLSAGCAIAMGRRLAPYRPAWYEEPVAPDSLDLLREVEAGAAVSGGGRRTALHAGGIPATPRTCAPATWCSRTWRTAAACGIGKKIAALAQAHDVRVAPHCSIGPVALCAAVHFGWATPGVLVQENFADYDVPWRKDLVSGWDPVRERRVRPARGAGVGDRTGRRGVCAACVSEEQLSVALGQAVVGGVYEGPGPSTRPLSRLQASAVTGSRHRRCEGPRRQPSSRPPRRRVSRPDRCPRRSR